jgi:hypothetical protein
MPYDGRPSSDGVRICVCARVRSIQLGKYTRFSLSKQLALNSEYEECIVDAENLAEINACQDPFAEPSSRAENVFDSLASLFNKFAPKPALEYDKDECVVFSESFAERQEC